MMRPTDFEVVYDMRTPLDEDSPSVRGRTIDNRDNTGYVDLTGSGLIELAGVSTDLVGEALNGFDGFGPVEEDYL